MSYAINGEVKPGERLYRLTDPMEEAHHENDKLTSTDIKRFLVTK